MDILDIISYYQNIGNQSVVNMLCEALESYKEFLLDEDYQNDFVYSSTDEDVSEGIPEAIQTITKKNGYSELK